MQKNITKTKKANSNNERQHSHTDIKIISVSVLSNFHLSLSSLEYQKIFQFNSKVIYKKTKCEKILKKGKREIESISNINVTYPLV